MSTVRARGSEPKLPEAEGVPVDAKLVNEIAEDMMFGPQSDHARIRHRALVGATRAYLAGWKAARAEGSKA